MEGSHSEVFRGAMEFPGRKPVDTFPIFVGCGGSAPMAGLARCEGVVGLAYDTFGGRSLLG